jgi:hypothetical protein
MPITCRSTAKSNFFSFPTSPTFNHTLNRPTRRPRWSTHAGFSLSLLVLILVHALFFLRKRTEYEDEYENEAKSVPYRYFPASLALRAVIFGSMGTVWPG